MDENVFDKMIAVNQKGAFLCTQAAARETTVSKMRNGYGNSSIPLGRVGKLREIAYLVCSGSVFSESFSKNNHCLIAAVIIRYS